MGQGPTGDGCHFLHRNKKRILSGVEISYVALPDLHKNWKYALPLGSIVMFVILYLLSAFEYPGGSWVHPGQEGFSWRYNYLCDLLDTRAIDGTLNSGRYWARAALAVLCLGLAWLWYYLPGLTKGSPRFKVLIRFSGLAAFATTVFLSSGTHDITVRLAGAFGLVGLCSLLVGLWRQGRKALALFGVWCLAIFLLNYAIYETGNFLRFLPVIQKITFVSFLAWFVWMDLALLRQETGQSGTVAETAEYKKQFNP